jgi:pyruvate/2-oxoglutarate dehydrogenase complex dihydrolipoamide dehydrogenase (E3) component
MSEILKPDVCILGAGGVGTALAIKARERGLSVVLVDKGSEEAGDPLQGTLQRAALIATARQAQAMRLGVRLGLDNALPKLNYKTITEHAEAVAAAGAPQSSPERLAALGVQRLVGEAKFTDRNTASVGDAVLKPAYLILAQGSTAAVPDLPGLSEIAYFTPDTILANVRKLTHLLVLGGDETALELAQIYRRLGSDVTLVPQGPLLGSYDKEASAILRRHLREEGVAILERATVKAFLPRSQGIGVSLDDADGRVASLDISHVLVAGARTPQLNWPSLEQARLRRQADDAARLHLIEHGQTSHPRILAVGGAAGESNLHLAIRQGERLLDRISGRSGGGKAASLPRLVATEPALAQWGPASAFETPKAGARILRANLGENEAARAQGQMEGMAKIVVDRAGAILAAAMVGQGAGEVIASLALAADRGIGAKDLSSLPITGTSALAVLNDLGNQFASQMPASNWSKRRASLGRFLP